jgi:hypothetical protein
MSLCIDTQEAHLHDGRFKLLQLADLIPPLLHSFTIWENIRSYDDIILKV